MSGLLAGKVWLSDLRRELKPLAATLADIANDDGTSIYPSVAYVAWRLSCSERSVQAGLAELREAKILAVVANKSGGRKLTTEYRLIEAKLPVRESWHSRRKGANPAPFSQAQPKEASTEKGADRGPRPSLPACGNLARTCGNLARKGADRGTKGCNPRRERVQPAAPDPSLPVKSKSQSQNLRPLACGNLVACGNLEAADLGESQNRWLGKGKGQNETTATPPQLRYAIVRRLTAAAAEILSRNPDCPLGDLGEKLKQWAATNGVPYFDAWPGAASPIQQAITNAFAQRRKTA